ncbi:MAG TPA: PQQ-like beta-propeller repeat protein [Myxococcota bacterium]|nr:PQQ-like beta-propeller repeat protein [Myxococcota bacterium]
MLVLLSALAVAGDWPAWLGPDRDATAHEPGLAAVWTGPGPRELWRTPLGKGISSLAVVDGVVYTMSDDAAGEHLDALDALTGKPRWRARVDAPYIDGMGFHGPRSTPTVIGDRVVSLTARGTLFAAARADGRVLWSVDLVGSLGGKRPTWGYSGSPLVSGDRVFVGVGADDGQGVAAFSLSEGKELWHTGGWGAAYSSPVRATLGGVDQVVFFTASGPVAVAPDTGASLWSLPWKTSYDVHAATPLVLPGDRLLISSGYGTGAALLQVGGAAPTEVWRSKSLKNKMATSVLYQGALYGFSDDHLVAVDAATGTALWDETGYGYGSLLRVDDNLLVLSEDGRLLLAPASKQGFTPLGASAYKVLHDKHCWTVPAIAGGVVYVRDNLEVAAFDLRPL